MTQGNTMVHVRLQHNEKRNYKIIAGVAAQRSVKDNFSSKGKTLKFDCSPYPNPVIDHHQGRQY